MAPEIWYGIGAFILIALPATDWVDKGYQGCVIP